jgi:hypothetical protein
MTYYIMFVNILTNCYKFWLGKVYFELIEIWLYLILALKWDKWLSQMVGLKKISKIQNSQWARITIKLQRPKNYDISHWVIIGLHLKWIVTLEDVMSADLPCHTLPP